MRPRGFTAPIGLAALLLLLAACSPDPQPASEAKCIAANFPSLDPKNKDQCIAACIKCSNGQTTTCATSCSLKGAR